MINRSYRKSTIPAHATCVFEGTLFDVYQWEQELYDGSKKIFERIVGRDIAKVVSVTEEGKFIIIDDEQPARPVLTKFPGGYVDDGETPDQSAARELLEETGYEPTDLVSFMTIEPWNKVDYQRIYFVARGCRKVREPAIEPGERISVRLLSFDELLQVLKDGIMDDVAIQIMALRALADPRKMEELRKLFGPIV